MKTINKIFSYLRRQRFHPNWFWGLILNDFFLTRNALRNFIYKNKHYISGDILDIGCGEKPYEELFKYNKYIGVDIENSGHDHEYSKIDLHYDGVNLPFADASFDSVVCFEVLEHVFEPEKLITEIRRVLKPGGNILLTTPFIWNEHEIPYDYGRYTFFGLRYLFEKKGFTIIKQKRILRGIPFFISLISASIREIQESARNIFPKNKTGKFFRAMVFLLFRPVFIFFNISGAILLPFSGYGNLYFNNGLIATKTIQA